mgnify:CR=1 FL=1
MRISAGAVFFLCWVNALSVWAEPEEINKRGCRDCHRLSSEEKQYKKGPDLFYAGDKFHRNWLKEFLQSPVVIHKAVYISDPDHYSGKPETNQPHIALTKDESERISDFLMTLRLPGLVTGKINEEPLSKVARAEAKILFERNFGCIACHKVLNLVGKVRGGVSGPSLVDSGLRLKSDWIFHWLKTPKKFLSKGRMPVFDLDDETAIHLTKYIFSIRTKP